MGVEMENSSSAVTVTLSAAAASGEASATSSASLIAPPLPPPPPPPLTKKKRNLPGMPDPDAEVIALSPKTLMATNRFVCEICNKGFQRDQNLQLHRRGHNLPWKLRQRTNKEVRKRVYVCPEASCVHHDPSRALGDLTGIKKHFCRKHGEKKWKCDKCAKKYAVLSDWKAHLKTCGTREYRCDCGTLFSRRDSFITHRAFCDALAEESNKAVQTVVVTAETKCSEEPKIQTVGALSSSSPPPLPPQCSVISALLPVQNPEMPNNLPPNAADDMPSNACANAISSCSSNGGSSSNSMCTSVFSSPSVGAPLQPQTTAYSDLICAMARTECPTSSIATAAVTEPTFLRLSPSNGFTLFGMAAQDERHYARPSQPAMSATALLQKAAQMGAAASSASLLRGFGISLTTSPDQQESLQGNHNAEGDSVNPIAGIGLGCAGDGGARLTELMTGPSSLFGSKPATLDFLGLGMAVGSTSTGGLSALISSMDGGGRLDIGTTLDRRNLDD
ncbi:hypothetical protein Sjap_016868 [Stephania japonica]|uniref:C2H2-type domain-containing protein n=1 Tax=Stephania japonica TaxID=461633 RepID=A0AAP0I538_9MAGN